MGQQARLGREVERPVLDELTIPILPPISFRSLNIVDVHT